MVRQGILAVAILEQTFGENKGFSFTPLFDSSRMPSNLLLG